MKEYNLKLIQLEIDYKLRKYTKDEYFVLKTKIYEEELAKLGL